MEKPAPMLTTIPESVTFLLHWLSGPGRGPYKKWIRNLHRGFYIPSRHRRAQLATSPEEDARARERIDRLLSNLKELVLLGKGDWKGFKKLGDQLNQKLERYRYSPYLILDQPVSWIGPPPRRLRMARGGVFRWGIDRFKSDIPPQELYALRVIERILGTRWVEHGNHPGLDAIRQCDICSRWFIAAKPWAKHCRSLACRQKAKKAYQTSEDYKANRRKIPR